MDLKKAASVDNNIEGAVKGSLDGVDAVVGIPFAGTARNEGDAVCSRAIFQVVVNEKFIVVTVTVELSHNRVFKSVEIV
jgi:hypothetical protein